MFEPITLALNQVEAQAQDFVVPKRHQHLYHLAHPNLQPSTFKVGGTLALIDFTKRSDRPNSWDQQLNRWWFANDGVYFDDAHTTMLKEVGRPITSATLPMVDVVPPFVALASIRPIMMSPPPFCTPSRGNHLQSILNHPEVVMFNDHNAPTTPLFEQHAKLKTVWFAENEARVPYTPLQATHYTFAGVKTKK